MNSLLRASPEKGEAIDIYEKAFTVGLYFLFISNQVKTYPHTPLCEGKQKNITYQLGYRSPNSLFVNTIFNKHLPLWLESNQPLCQILQAALSNEDSTHREETPYLHRRGVE